MLFVSLRRMLRRRGPQAFEDVQAQRSILKLTVYLVVIFALHSAAMMTFEHMSLGSAAWLTASTVTTVGYGDVSAASAAGQWSTVILLYIGGIFALAKGAGDYFDYRASRRERMLRGRWRWHMEDHVLLVNAPRPGAVQYFDTLIRQFAEIDWGRNRRILILTDAWPEGLPAELQELGAVHVHGSGAQEGMLALADAASAAVIIVLAEDHVAQQADSIAFDVVHRARAINSNCSIVAECGDDRNRARLREAGATSVVRPMRGYPEMMVRAVVSPGSEFILEDLFDARGDECRRYEISVDGLTWGQLASTLMLKGIGTAIAFEKAADGAIEINPRPEQVVTARALHIIAKEGHTASAEDVRRIANGAAAG